jgi:DNA-binding transcriptional MerR regulator
MPLRRYQISKDELAKAAGMVKQSSSTDIPDKLYFPIREAAEIVGVEPYVLRFWEREFPMFRPVKGGSGHRRYRRKDIETALEVKRLLYEQGFTIAGARIQLKNIGGETGNTPNPPARAKKQPQLPFPELPRPALLRLRRELNEILTILDKT